jgi:hypothetical protein
MRFGCAVAMCSKPIAAKEYILVVQQNMLDAAS